MSRYLKHTFDSNFIWRVYVYVSLYLWLLVSLAILKHCYTKCMAFITPDPLLRLLLFWATNKIDKKKATGI